jgi:Arc/MetJ-type ribon-helix-helix transcriptional regulator
MQIDDSNLDCFDMIVCGNEIYCEWDSNKKELIRRALREMQQKRLMNNSIIKNLKKQCQIAPKNYLCPICKTKNNDILQASHIGQPIIKKINNIVDRYIDTLDFYELYKKVIEEEDNSLITVACRKCNKDLEDK